VLIVVLQRLHFGEVVQLVQRWFNLIIDQIRPFFFNDFCILFDVILNFLFFSFLLQSLCNACGIRSRKKKRDILGLNKGAANDKRAKKGSNNNGSSNNNNNKQLGDGSKQRLLALGREVLMQRRKLGEEEQAAVLLMALSYGSVYA